MIAKSFLKRFSSFFSAKRHFKLPFPALVGLSATLAFGVQLDNWRLPYYQESSIRSGRGSSPSGMFWDDIGGQPDFNSALWPDSIRFSKDHWIIEPAVSYCAQSFDTLYIDTSPPIAHYVNDKNQAQRSQQRGPYWNGQFLSDIRYRKLLIRQVLDVDSRNKDDLDYRGKTDRFAAGRIAEAYCQVDWNYGFFRLGRLNRNWGPFPDRSLLISSNSLSYDAFEFQLASSFFEFRHMFAAFPYDKSNIDAEGHFYDRYLTAHSLNFMLGRFGAVGITETMLFSRNSGLPDFQLTNPFSIYTVINTNGEGTGNLMLGVQWALHPVIQNVSVKGQVLIDDFQVDNKGPQDQEPTHWGGDFGAYCSDVLPLHLSHTISLEYRYLSRWLYTVDPANTSQGERYTYLGRSLGEPTNDGDRINLSFFTAGRNYWAATAGVSLTRQGQNSLWSMWKNISKDSLIAPNELGYRTEPAFPSGIVERTSDFYVDLRGYYKNLADIRLRLDNRWVKNKNNALTASSSYDPMVSLTLSLHYCNFFVPIP